MCSPARYPSPAQVNRERVFRGGGGRPPTAVIVDYIDAYRPVRGRPDLCRAHRARRQIAPSTYYAAKQQGPISAADLDDAYAANTVFDLWVANRRVYGVRKLWHAAKRAGHRGAAIRWRG